MIPRALRLLNTLKHLKPVQLAFFIVRRKFPSARVSYSGVPSLNPVLSFVDPISISGCFGLEGRFRFLNVERDLGQDVDWCPSGVSRLWGYNLHYFDYLRDEACSADNGKRLITSWIKRNPQGSQPGWEPFTASLRIVNWVFFLGRHPQLANEEMLRSLYEQALWLERNDERHILANHYFENLKALAFAGFFFSGSDARRWRKKGARGVLAQLNEQTLADGGHYERTPQYHALMLENYLDLLNLARNTGEAEEQLSVEVLCRYCRNGLLFYQQVLFPDGQPPLFNDTAFGIAPSFEQLDDYSQKLLGSSVSVEELRSAVSLKESGLFLYRYCEDMLAIDAGDIGPSYQPGHTHCDMLSYELMLGGQRVVVDTGVCEYQPGETRKFLRSTRAHNTVSVDGAEQSEVWGEFRVARRAKILRADFESGEASSLFEGAYQGFHRVGRRVEHHRKIQIIHSPKIESISVFDTVKGAVGKPFESFIHLHPDVELVEQSERSLCFAMSAELKFKIEIPSDATYELEPAFYCPEFGVKKSNVRIVLKPVSPETNTLSYTIRKYY